MSSLNKYGTILRSVNLDPLIWTHKFGPVNQTVRYRTLWSILFIPFNKIELSVNMTNPKSFFFCSKNIRWFQHYNIFSPYIAVRSGTGVLFHN